MRHVEHALCALVDEKIREVLRNHTKRAYCQLAAILCNAKYMKCDGWYLMASINWRGETKHVQLSHRELWTEQTVSFTQPQKIDIVI